MSTPIPAQQLTFAAANAELGEILAALDGDRLDVDAVVAAVERAADLIGVCRSRLSGAAARVQVIAADLTAPTD